MIPSRSLYQVVAAALLAASLASADEPAAGESEALAAGWQEQYLGTDPEVRFYPDGNANYWAYHLDRNRVGREVGLRIEGRFPQARYMSVTVYDDKTLTAIEHLTDVQIKAGSGGINPFAPPPAGLYPTGGYRILVVPRGAAPHSAERNVIEYDPGLRAVSVFLRYYVPALGPTGGVALPSVTAFDLRTGKTVEPQLPRSARLQRKRVRAQLAGRFLDKYINRKLEPLFSLALLDRSLSAFRADSQGLYANADNKYLVMPIVKRPDQVALIRFRPPKVVAPSKSGGDVRYWSISLGDDKSFNAYTLADDQAKIGRDGYVTIVVAEPGHQVLEKARDVNFIPWTLGTRGVLIYRNLVTRNGFAGDFDKIPELSDPGGWSQVIGQRFIGSYAPSGRLMSTTEFLALKTLSEG